MNIHISFQAAERFNFSFCSLFGARYILGRSLLTEETITVAITNTITINYCCYYSYYYSYYAMTTMLTSTI